MEPRVPMQRFFGESRDAARARLRTRPDALTPLVHPPKPKGLWFTCQYDNFKTNVLVILIEHHSDRHDTAREGQE